MPFRLVIRRERVKRAVITGIAASVVFTLVAPVPGAAGTTLQYRDVFQTPSYNGSDGTDAWAGPWVETGEVTDPDEGAIQADSESHCHTDVCLVIGKDSSSGDAAIQRAFSSDGASTVTLTFDFERHPHNAGAGEVRVLGSKDGVAWSPIATYLLVVEDGSQQSASHDISWIASSDSEIKFDLVGNTDSSHMNIDNIQVTVVTTSPPSFDQNLGDRTDDVGDTVSIDAGASDPDSINLTYSATGLPAGVAIEPTTGLISGTIAAAAVTGSPHDVKVVVTDPETNGDLDTFTWTIVKPNAAPNASDRTATVDQDDPGGVSIWLLDPTFVSDPDGDTVSLSGFDPNTGNGTIVDQGAGWVKYTPNGGFSGSDSFGYEVSDGVGGFASATVEVTVTPVATTTTTTTTTTLPPTTTTVPPATTTTTTTTTPTTTTVPPTPTTTLPITKPPTPPPVNTSTTVPEVTTTTTVPETTTTTAVELSPAPTPTTTTTAPPAEITREEAQVLKEDLVIVSASPQVGGVAIEAQAPNHELDPLEGLTVTFASAVEALQTHLLSSIVLGIVLAVLLMLGVEERDKQRGHAAT